ncbi:MAG: glycosyltransferase family 4 protein, partial [Ignavibacteria bacterium]|nr:glycosyltransferase family 4 protein [Ignavibacteria bacterium]
FLLLCVSNFLPTKRQDLLIEVFKKLGRNDVTLVLISKWGDEKFQKIIHTLAWGLNNVRILENIPREDTVSAFKSADLFVFASEIEAFPLVLLEAQISKTPFVSTDCGNSKELSGGIVCEINEFPKVINQLLDNESLRIELAQKGYDETIKFYTWEKVIEKYNKLFIELYYKKLVKNKQSYLKNIVQPKLGNIEESFLMYLRRNPFDLSIRLELAKRYINIGEIDSAKNLLYSIISIDCKNYEANKLLEEINLKTYEEDTYANI